MKHFYSLSLTLLVSVLLFGCATARVVSVMPGEGGELAVSPAGSLEARQKAELLMQQNCGGKTYKVTKEGEAVVGSYTHTNGQSQKLKGGYRVSSGTSHTEHNRMAYPLSLHNIAQKE